MVYMTEIHSSGGWKSEIKLPGHQILCAVPPPQASDATGAFRFLGPWLVFPIYNVFPPVMFLWAQYFLLIRTLQDQALPNDLIFIICYELNTVWTHLLKGHMLVAWPSVWGCWEVVRPLWKLVIVLQRWPILALWSKLSWVAGSMCLISAARGCFFSLVLLLWQSKNLG